MHMDWLPTRSRRFLERDVPLKAVTAAVPAGRNQFSNPIPWSMRRIWLGSPNDLIAYSSGGIVT